MTYPNSVQEVANRAFGRVMEQITDTQTLIDHLQSMYESTQPHARATLLRKLRVRGGGTFSKYIFTVGTRCVDTGLGLFNGKKLLATNLKL